jgi:ribonucleoside-diphosphate reductase alpha chain
LVKDRKLQITGTKEQIILKKYWISRVKKFANNYFGGDLQKTIYCLKDLNLLHK